MNRFVGLWPGTVPRYAGGDEYRPTDEVEAKPKRNDKATLHQAPCSAIIDCWRGADKAGIEALRLALIGLADVADAGCPLCRS